MENPFKTIGEAFTAGLEKLHDRIGGVEREVKADIASFKDEVGDFKAKVEGDVGEIAELKDRIAKVEAMFAPEAVSAAVDKVSSAGGAPAASQAPAVTPPEPETLAEPTPAAPSATVAAVVADTGAPAEHVEPAVQAHADAIAAGSPPEVAHADAMAAAASAGAAPEVASVIADAVATQPAASA